MLLKIFYFKDEQDIKNVYFTHDTSFNVKFRKDLTFNDLLITDITVMTKAHT